MKPTNALAEEGTRQESSAVSEEIRTKSNNYEGPKDAEKPLLIFIREHAATSIITEECGKKVGSYWCRELSDQECEAYSNGFLAGLCEGILKGRIKQSELVADALKLKFK